MQVELESRRSLRFDDGAPVRAASAVAPLGASWLVAQDDATHAALVGPMSTTRLRLLPPVQGHDVFSSADGTKHLKPDLEAACPVLVDGQRAVLLLGSGSTPARTHLVLVGESGRVLAARALPSLYARLARALGRSDEQLNLEGCCLVGDRLRWFARGLPAAGVPSATVEVDLAGLLAAVRGGDAPVELGEVHELDLGSIDGAGLAVTDAVALPDGLVLVAAAAEDTPNAVDDGPVLASALALLDGDRVRARAVLPLLDGRVAKVEGLALLADDRVLAVVDDDDVDRPSDALVLRVDRR